jgi:hypothetical protein
VLTVTGNVDPKRYEDSRRFIPSTTSAIRPQLHAVDEDRKRRSRRGVADGVLTVRLPKAGRRRIEIALLRFARPSPLGEARSRGR